MAEGILNLKEWLRQLVEHHAKARGKLAERISQLLEENTRLNNKLAF